MPLRDDLLTPIAGSNPSGVSLRYDPVTDKVKEARREDIDAPQGEWKTALKVADHNQAIKLAGEAIAKRGKDLQLVAWLVDSHIRRDGFSMLAPCFQLMHDLLDQFWDTIHPEIEDGDTETRSAPLEWLGSKLEEPVRGLPITSSKMTWVHYKESRTVGYEKDANNEEKKKTRQKLVADGKLTAEEFDAAVDGTPKAFLETIQKQIEDGLESLATLIDLCDEKFGEYSPSFIKSRTALEEIVQFVKTCVNKKGGPTPVAAPAVEAPPPPEPVAAAPVAAAPAPVAAPAPAPAVVVSSGGIDPVDIDDAGVRLAAIARFLRKKDVYAIGPFLMLRGYRWGEIRYNGPEIDAKMLAAPPAELRSELKERFLASDWDGVLATTEKAMELPCGRGWLDIQRYTVRALEAKGEWFKFVADGVRTELRGLLTDLPGLLHLTLLDDTPTANPDTMKWIQEEVLTPASGDGMLGDMPPSMYEAPPVYQAAPPPPPPPPPPVVLNEAPPEMEQEEPAEDRDAIDKALSAARGGRLDEAIQIVTEALARERTGRGRYKRRMQLAHLFVAAQKHKIAYPMLRELSAEIDRRQLEDWESGEVLAHPLVLLMQCMSALGADETQRAELYDRICRLDPVQALNCQE